MLVSPNVRIRDAASFEQLDVYLGWKRARRCPTRLCIRFCGFRLEFGCDRDRDGWVSLFPVPASRELDSSNAVGRHAQSRYWQTMHDVFEGEQGESTNDLD
jgi:hypothetical protein